jgi:hypothetical protein
MTQKRTRKPRPEEALPEGGILDHPVGSFGIESGPEVVTPILGEPAIGPDEVVVELTAADLGLDGPVLEMAKQVTRDNFSEIVASEVKAQARQTKGLSPVFDMGKSLRDRLGPRLSYFEVAPEDRPGSTCVVCPAREFVFDPKNPERDYRYEVKVVADSDAQLSAAIDALLAAANQPVLFAGLRIWLHAAGRHTQAAVKVRGGQIKKVVELIFRASEP